MHVTQLSVDGLRVLPLSDTLGIVFPAPVCSFQFLPGLLLSLASVVLFSLKSSKTIFTKCNGMLVPVRTSVGLHRRNEKNNGLYQLKVVDMWPCEMMNDYEMLNLGY